MDRSATASLARRAERLPHYDREQIRLPSNICGSARRDTTAYQPWNGKYALELTISNPLTRRVKDLLIKVTFDGNEAGLAGSAIRDSNKSTSAADRR